METQQPSTIGDNPVMIGRYRIVRLLGEGGMGSVYLAEQESPNRVVALKVIKPAFVNSETLYRFEQEAQVLGRLHHPGIAQVYEAGTADNGLGPQPYFAMELIEGDSLLEFAREKGLKLRARLELMAKICDAVNHAHQRGIIHRDLKPTNILVDETGQPKILDFGVARLTDSDTTKTRQTDIGQLIGTLNYMSPEQVLADPQKVDFRSDVYALGVITYELLAGRLPYDTARKPLHEVVRTIREQDPAPLSSIDRIYRGDVETIIAKALEKDKSRRYASAAEMAADIRHYLAHEPIVARPPSTSYQLQKFARRHRVLVGAVAAVFLVLIAGVVVSTWQAVKARRAEAAAQAVNDFLQNDLLAQASAISQSGSNTAADPDLKVRTALDRAAERIGGKFDRQPEVEAAIRDTIGQTYMELGLYTKAQKQLELALGLRQRAEGAEDTKTLNTERRLGDVLERQGKYPESEALQSRTLQTMIRVLGPEHPDTLKSMNALAWVYNHEAMYAQAEALLNQALEIERRVQGPERPDTLASMNSLANVYNNEGKYSQAEALYSQTVEIERRVLGPENPDTLNSMNILAVVYNREGKYAQAETLLTQILDTRRRVLGPEHPDTLTGMNNLGTAYSLQGKFAQGEAIYRQTLEIRLRVLGPEHPDTLQVMNNLTFADSNQGKYAQAETLASQTLEIRRRVLGPEHPATLTSMNSLASAYSLEGKYAQAEPLFNQTLEARRRVLRPEHPDTLDTLSDMAYMYQSEGKYGQAENYAEQALAGRRHTLGPDHPQTIASEADLALAYESQGKFTESEPLARQAEATERMKQPDNWLGCWAESLLGASLAGEKKYAEAEPLLLEGYRDMAAQKDRITAPNWRHLDSAHEWIVSLYKAWGKPQKAIERRHT
jgi:tetratricopeptide (TPR) repeat protein/predicted Ser/Thr protein kinase